MTRTSHRLFIAVLVLIVVLALILLVLNGASYYKVPFSERFYHPAYKSLKPSGIMGHGLGIAGSFLMLAGIFSYMARKRYRFMLRWGLLKHWLEFHIFLCTLGPMLIVFHTTFKIGGLVAVSFWSMTAVFLSGIAGRFIYLSIPRSIEGRELSLGEVKQLRNEKAMAIRYSTEIDPSVHLMIEEAIGIRTEQSGSSSIDPVKRDSSGKRQLLKHVREILRESGLSSADRKQVVELIREEFRLNRRIESLERMQKLFRYWHVAHLPLAMVMLVIMCIHIAVTIVFGYRWIF